MQQVRYFEGATMDHLEFLLNEWLHDNPQVHVCSITYYERQNLIDATFVMWVLFEGV